MTAPLPDHGAGARYRFGEDGDVWDDEYEYDIDDDDGDDDLPMGMNGKGRGNGSLGRSGTGTLGRSRGGRGSSTRSASTGTGSNPDSISRLSGTRSANTSIGASTSRRPNGSIHTRTATTPLAERFNKYTESVEDYQDEYEYDVDDSPSGSGGIPGAGIGRPGTLLKLNSRLSSRSSGDGGGAELKWGDGDGMSDEEDVFAEVRFLFLFLFCILTMDKHEKKNSLMNLLQKKTWKPSFKEINMRGCRLGWGCWLMS